MHQRIGSVTNVVLKRGHILRASGRVARRAQQIGVGVPDFSTGVAEMLDRERRVTIHPGAGTRRRRQVHEPEAPPSTRNASSTPAIPKSLVPIDRSRRRLDSAIIVVETEADTAGVIVDAVDKHQPIASHVLTWALECPRLMGVFRSRRCADVLGSITPGR